MDYNKVEPFLGDWGIKLKDFIESSDFDAIFTFLKEESREGKIICPEWKNIFRAFKECPYKELKVIIIGQDPYPWVKYDHKTQKNVYVADGIAMSCRNTGILQPSLELFYKGIEDDLGIKTGMNPDLTYLANQGILFLNTSLTVEANKRDSHKGRWDKFINYLLTEVINFYNTGLVYLMLGKNAEIIGKAIVPFIHWGITVEHPAAGSHNDRDWNHEKCFSSINKILKNHNNIQINWAYGNTR